LIQKANDVVSICRLCNSDTKCTISKFGILNPGIIGDGRIGKDGIDILVAGYVSFDDTFLYISSKDGNGLDIIESDKNQQHYENVPKQNLA